MVRISNNLIAILIIIFGIIMSYNNWLIYKNVGELQVTGLVTETAELTLTIKESPPPAPPDEEESSSGPSAIVAPEKGGAGFIILVEEEILPSIKVDKNLIKVTLKENESKIEFLKITNDGNIKLELNLKIEDLEEFVFISDRYITLDPGESKLITLEFLGKFTGFFSGNLIIKENQISESVMLILEVQPKEVLFNIEKPLIPIKPEFQFIRVLIILILILIILIIFNLRDHKESKYIIKIKFFLRRIKHQLKRKKKLRQQ